VVLVVAGLGSGLGLAEILLTALGQPRIYAAPVRDPNLFTFRDEKLRGEIGWINKPSAEIRFRYDGDPRGYFGASATVVHRTNSMGFRGAEFRRDKGARTRRLVFLGDSMTFGEGVKDEDPYPVRVCAELARAAPGLQFECQNWGVSAYNTVREAALLEWALGFAPDVIVLGFFPNDAEELGVDLDARRVEGQDALLLGPSDGALDPRRCPTRLVRLVCATVGAKLRTRRVLGEYRDLFADPSPGWSASRDALRRIGAACQAERIPCYALLIPVLWDLPDYPLLPEHRRIVAALEDAQLRVIDLLPALQVYEGPELWVHPTDPHANDAAQAVAGGLVAKRLLADLGDAWGAS
jgi:hypothetical protein